MEEHGGEWAVDYAGGREGLLRECGVALVNGGVAVVSESRVLLGWLVEEGRVFYVHLAYGEMRGLVELARMCLGRRADGVERVRFERGMRVRDRGMRDVELDRVLKIEY